MFVGVHFGIDATYTPLRRETKGSQSGYEAKLDVHVKRTRGCFVVSSRNDYEEAASHSNGTLSKGYGSYKLFHFAYEDLFAHTRGWPVRNFLEETFFSVTD